MAASRFPIRRTHTRRSSENRRARAGCQSLPRVPRTAMPAPMATSRWTSWAPPPPRTRISNSYNPRMRQIYGTYARKDSGFYMLAGQAWSFATLSNQGLRGHSEQVPMTIDGSFVPGFDWTWNPQMRFVKEFSNKFSAGISFESPQANIFNGPNALPPNTVFSNPGGP